MMRWFCVVRCMMIGENKILCLFLEVKMIEKQIAYCLKGYPKCPNCHKTLNYFKIDYQKPGHGVVKSDGVEESQDDYYSDYALHCPHCDVGFSDLTIEEAMLILSCDKDIMKFSVAKPFFK